MSSDKAKQAAEEYFNQHEALIDIVHGPERIDFSPGKHVAMPIDEYPKQIKSAHIAGRAHFIEHELTEILEEAKCFSWQQVEHYSIDDLIEKARKG